MNAVKMFVSSENREILKTRFVSLLWSIGTVVAVFALDWVAANLNLFNLPSEVVVLLGLILAQVTKYLKVNLPELKKELKESN